MKKPFISIILPVRNNGKNLSECLKSLRSQKYRNFEVIAIDDASSDDSYELLKRFKMQFKKLRVYKNVKRYGQVMTLNRLLRRTKGDFIAFIDADDFAHPNRLKKQANFLLKNPEVVAVGTQTYFINTKGTVRSKSSFPKENSLIYSSPLHGLSMQFESVMLNKSLLPKDVLKFDQGALPFIYSDFLIKLLPFGKFANLPNFLHYHRNNPKIYLLDIQKNIISFIKLVLRSKELHDYQRAYRLIFTSLIKPTFNT